MGFFICPVCSARFEEYEDLDEHKDSNHPGYADRQHSGRPDARTDGGGLKTRFDAGADFDVDGIEARLVGSINGLEIRTEWRPDPSILEGLQDRLEASVTKAPPYGEYPLFDDERVRWEWREREGDDAA